MATTPDAHRNVPLAVIEDYLERGLPGIIAVQGSPTGGVVIDPHHRRLGVRAQGEGRAPDIVEYQNLSFEQILDDAAPWQQLTVQLADNTEEVYALLCAILDRVQVAGEPFADAVEAAVDSLTGILAVKHALSREEQLGLFGELLVLLALVEQLGPIDALDVWRGPLHEEHDFGLSAVDLEVKTTLAERREHWISTATQLSPTGSRPLYLVSIQLTAAGLDSGWGLPSLVKQVGLAVGHRKARFDSVLGAVGYRNRDSPLYRSRWTFRTKPLFYVVDDDFPALTRERLNAAVPSATRIREIRYRLDLTDMQPSESVFQFDAVAELAETTWTPQGVDHDR